MKAIFIQPYNHDAIIYEGCTSLEFLKKGWDFLYIIKADGRHGNNIRPEILEEIRAEEIKKEMKLQNIKVLDQKEFYRIKRSPEVLEKAKKRLEEYMKEGRITLTEGDIIKKICSLPENSSDLTCWSEFIYDLRTLNTPEDIYKCFSQLHKIQKQDSPLIMTNMINQEDYPKGQITIEESMENIKSIISKFFEPVCEESRKIFKEDKEFNYMRWIFKKNYIK